MPRFDFQSPGAAAGDALRRFMQERDMKRRQDLLDKITIDNQRAQLAEQQRQATRQQQRDQQADADRVDSRADRLATIHGPDADLSEQVADALSAGNYPIQSRNTLPARTLDMDANAIPGVVSGAAPKAPFMVPGVAMRSAGYKRRGETEVERQARDQRKAAAAERTADRTFRHGQADEANDVRLEIARANATQRAEAATARLEQARTTTEIQQSRLELQQALADLKIDDVRKERRQTESAVAVGRSEVRELAQSLIDDPNLDTIAGPVEGRRDTFFKSGNVDALRRLQQLVNKLSLEGRGKLKGQGAVSDFEGRMLAAAVSAIDRAAGPDTVRKHLGDIVKAFEGDRPFEQAGGNGAVTLRDPQTGTTRTVQRGSAQYRVYTAAGAVEVR